MGGLVLALGACSSGPREAPKPEPPPLPTRTADGRIIIRGQGLTYALRPPQGWVARSVRGADRSTKSTVTVADIAPPDGAPVLISGQMRTKNREIDSIESWVERVTLTRRNTDRDFTMSRAGTVAIVGGRRGEMIVLENSEPAEGGQPIDHEAVVLIEEPGAIAEIFLTTKTKDLLEQNLLTLRMVAASYSPLR
ncbi:hypothetical protein [Reyranella sp. CPCC 100927]|uniref:hypothetical protein n=1 Tax=Reyranella sp. CPCC 100927 TaxID=2599616 RepID=UPI0011B7EAD1|nr:hypothetical protein [Reyranella sp. CPCC 100927]TWT08829.1 hypothetical protein FQU96_22685 [Reyranella sp. CPCC 100927]